mgnify:CR=1 FL=1
MGSLSGARPGHPPFLQVSPVSRNMFTLFITTLTYFKYPSVMCKRILTNLAPRLLLGALCYTYETTFGVSTGIYMSYAMPFAMLVKRTAMLLGARSKTSGTASQQGSREASGNGLHSAVPCCAGRGCCCPTNP